MPLWSLKPLDSLPYERGDNPWVPPYDKKHGFVVRAETADEARLVAARDSYDEGRNAWLDPDLSECIALTGSGDAGVILSDFRSG